MKLEEEALRLAATRSHDPHAAILASLRRVAAAERRRIRQAIRAAAWAEAERWTAMAAAADRPELGERYREDGMRVMRGIDVALGCVRGGR